MPIHAKKTAIPAAIKLLEEEDFDTFLEKFSPSVEFKKNNAKAPLSEMAKRFRGKKRRGCSAPCVA